MISPDLVRQAQHGDQQALNGLLGALRPRLVRYCTRKLGPDDGEDAAQEALARLVVSLGAYRQQRPIEAYAYWLASNCVADTFRRKYRDRAQLMAEVPEQEPAPGLSPVQPEEHVLRDDETRALARHLQAVSPQARTVLLLRTEGFSADEVAERLGSTPGAVRIARWRAVQKLRKAVTT